MEQVVVPRYNHDAVGPIIQSPPAVIRAGGVGQSNRLGIRAISKTVLEVQ